jgi:sulfate/thiosulfate-binding protein
MKSRIIIFILSLLVAHTGFAKEMQLLNVSYDPTREFYEEYNDLFAKHWKKEIAIKQSHGGSGKQARAVIDGLQADVVTLALAYDIDAIAEKSDLLPKNWQSKLPNESCPYTSTIVFLVKKGNPKKITDWDDLVRKGIEVITPNPKTSGGARWNHLAAYGYAMKKYKNDERKAQKFMQKFYANVPMLDAGARGSAMTFVQRGIGDVLVTWENEAYLARDQLGKNKFEIVMPSMSIKAEPPVAVIEKVAAKRGTTEAATEYLNYLYSPKAQSLAAKYHYRTANTPLPKINMITIEDFGGWKKAQREHFDDGGIFDQSYGQ